MELAAGLLIIIMGILHIIYSEKQQVPELQKVTQNSNILGSLRVMSLQGGLLLLAVGSVHVLSYFNIIILNGIAAYFPLGLICINLLAFLLIAVFRHRELFSIVALQLLAFTIIIILQVMSIK
ncbi:hypothetical protein HQ531_07060 [bacterium]|nr:hypothetical protein [bacterium]